MRKDLELGDTVRDRVSGITGVALGRATHLNRCIQICIEPLGFTDGKPHEGFFVDEEQIDVVERGTVPRSEWVSPIDIPLGSVVSDRISCLTGVAVVCVDWVDGTRRYEVRPQGADKTGKPFGSVSMLDVQIKIVQDVPAVQTNKTAQTGGDFGLSAKHPR